MDIQVERTGMAYGLEYEVVATSMGHRCGYVRIPDGHTLFGRGYQEPAPGVATADMENVEVGKRGVMALFGHALDDGDTVSLDVLFDVHGSLTFAGNRHSDTDWWLGFDCGHYGDGRDLSIMDEEFQQIWGCGGDGPIRTAEYVEGECQSLARQIVERYPLEGKEVGR